MLSSKNVHFAILGIILGGTFGYVLAFYQAESAVPAPVAANPAESSTVSSAAAGSPGVTPEHPDITDDQMQELFKGAIEKNPGNPELLTRYANFLFDLRKYGESVDWYQKALVLQPTNIDIRTDLATALYRMGRADEAIAEYQKSLAADPRHMLTLLNMFVVYADSKKDLTRAEAILRQMEQIDPAYQALPSLRKKLEEERAGTAR